MSNISNSIKKKKVRVLSSRWNIYYKDKLTYDERVKLWSSPIELKSYTQDAKKDISEYLFCHGNAAALEPSKHCIRGLEALIIDEMSTLGRKKTREYVRNGVLELQGLETQEELYELYEIEQLGTTPEMVHPKTLKMLTSVISKLSQRGIAVALKNASEDRLVADQIYKEEFGSNVQILATRMAAKTTADEIPIRLPLPKEPLPQSEVVARSA